MIVLLLIFLAIVLVFLLIWVYRMKKSMKEHFILENELQYEVGHDGLTGLVNAPLMIDRLEQSIKNAKIHKQKVAILYLKVDYFKQINQILGFDVPNEFMQALSQRLVACVGNADTVAKVEEDDFVIVIENFEKLSSIQDLVVEILDITQEPFKVRHHHINFNFSIGISLYPNDTVDTMNLLSHAHTAMKMVEEKGCNGYKFYTLELAEESFKNEKLEYELVQSLVNNEIKLSYQLEFDALNDTLVGITASPCWNHSSMGLLDATEFIPLSEEIGFASTIDKWTMQNALNDFDAWRANGLNVGTLFLDISSQTLQQNTFLDEMKTLLAENKRVEYLQLRIQAKQFIAPSTCMVNSFNELHALGVKFCLDSVGASSVSLEAIQKLHIDTLKIDSEVIENLFENKELVQTILGIASSLNIKSMASGVQTQAQRDFLLENACGIMNAKLYPKALSSKKMEEVLEELAQ